MKSMGLKLLMIIAIPVIIGLAISWGVNNSNVEIELKGKYNKYEKVLNQLNVSGLKTSEDLSLKNWGQQRKIAEKIVKELSKVKYDANDIFDYWQTPEETIKNRKGDCEDKALYIAYRLRQEGLNSTIVLGLTKNSNNGHAWVEVDLDGRWTIIDGANDSSGKKMFSDNDYEYYFYQSKYKAVTYILFGSDGYKIQDANYFIDFTKIFGIKVKGHLESWGAITSFPYISLGNGSVSSKKP